MKKLSITISIILIGSSLLPQTFAASKVTPDGFGTEASCYGGSVSFGGRQLFAEGFPGKYCSECCGGNVEVIASINDYDDGEVRCVAWGKLGRNDDISVAHWFEKSRRAGWVKYGQSSLCETSQKP